MRPFSISTPSDIDQAREAVELAEKWYDSPSTVGEVAAIAKDVLAWLRLNREKTDRNGDTVNGSWFALQSLDHTDDGRRLDIRRSLFRSKLYGTGLRRLLNRMVHEQMLANEAYAQIRDFTDFTRMTLHDELMGYKLASETRDEEGRHRPLATVNLEDLKERFELSPGGNATKLRDSIVCPMASFGLLRVKIDNENRYAISIGRVAHIFHTEVFTPVREEFEPKLKGRD